MDAPPWTYLNCHDLQYPFSLHQYLSMCTSGMIDASMMVVQSSTMVYAAHINPVLHCPGISMDCSSFAGGGICGPCSGGWCFWSCRMPSHNIFRFAGNGRGSFLAPAKHSFASSRALSWQIAFSRAIKAISFFVTALSLSAMAFHVQVGAFSVNAFALLASVVVEVLLGADGAAAALFAQTPQIGSDATFPNPPRGPLLQLCVEHPANPR